MLEVMYVIFVCKELNYAIRTCTLGGADAPTLVFFLSVLWDSFDTDCTVVASFDEGVQQEMTGRGDRCRPESCRPKPDGGDKLDAVVFTTAREVFLNWPTHTHTHTQKNINERR